MSHDTKRRESPIDGVHPQVRSQMIHEFIFVLYRVLVKKVCDMAGCEVLTFASDRMYDTCNGTSSLFGVLIVVRFQDLNAMTNFSTLFGLCRQGHQRIVLGKSGTYNIIVRDWTM